QITVKELREMQANQDAEKHSLRPSRWAAGATAMVLSASLLLSACTGGAGAPVVDPAATNTPSTSDAVATPEVSDTEESTDTEGTVDTETMTDTEGTGDSGTMTDTEGTGDTETMTDTEGTG